MNPIGMQNLNDTEPGGLLSEADFEALTRKQWPMPVVIPTRRTLLQRAWRAVRCFAIRWQIGANEQWLRDCERDGVLSPRVRHAVDLQNQELRCKLAVLEQS